MFHTTMPLKTLLGTFAAVYYFFLGLLPEVSSNVYRRSLLLLRRFQRSRHVAVALLNTDPLRLRRIRRAKQAWHVESLTVEYRYEALPVEIKNKSLFSYASLITCGRHYKLRGKIDDLVIFTGNF